MVKFYVNPLSFCVEVEQPSVFPIFYINISRRPVVAQRQSVTVKPIGYAFDPTRGDKIFIKIYISISSLWLSAVLSSATQHTMPPEFSRKWGTQH